MTQFHFDAESYRPVRAEVPRYDELQEQVSSSLTGQIPRILDLGSGPGRTAVRSSWLRDGRVISAHWRRGSGQHVTSMDCPDCGYLYGARASAELPDAFGSIASQFRSILRSNTESVLRLRPGAAVWSPLEYACHVRDVLLAQRERVFLALVEDEPSFASIYRDQRVELDRYNSSAPEQVAQEIKVAAGMLGWLAQGLSSAQRARPCLYNYPEPARRDVAWLLQHALHEAVHHLRDVEMGVERTIGIDAPTATP